jgi:non-heme chloroperoxidase
MKPTLVQLTAAGCIALAVGFDAASVAAQQASPALAAGSQRAQPEVRRSRLRLATGVELDIVQAGPEGGVPVLLLHGYTDSWFSYRRVLERLPAGIRAIVPSQRGHGESERPACCYGIHDFADDAAALLDRLGVESAVVIGHSLGSFVAQQLAARHPERVSALVLIGSGTTLATEAVAELAAFVETLEDPVSREFIREFQESTVAVPLPAGFLAGIIAESGRVPARVWRDVARGMIATPATPELQRVEAPALVVWGEEDGLFGRSEQDALVAALPRAELVVFEESGHAPHWEHPDRFASELQRFVSRVAAGRARR